MTGDLFGGDLLPGLRYQPAVLDEEQERAILAQLEAVELAPFRFQGWLGKRKTHTFGWRYDFEDSSFAPSEPLPAWLQPLQRAAADLAGVAADAFVHALIARYDPGAGIGWHRDRPVFDTVVGFSFGAPAVLRFRRRKPDGFDRVSLKVEPRSVYLLTGTARHEWEHSIAPGAALRFSITLRTLSDLGRRKAAAN
ncbi:alpha-ketoglutarate-dependent dioxygenase AlkB [Sphingomonas sinipercae]|uniref:Alpha-ketoglutarate-dependent dioxygenase AlkB n=1 Tax=Sphingomonas sinipercae TaxID=2714944 RepID=A0A6G7ZKG4_9SPHN|nr:alpha-ketoglutarate-dependent dioxygenase AlkB [Sphingomonas sinipercae]QIL01400.1 alpha-ketoglutarate-dependent dioxygenase AlkB [Sphingomonas sinipercae]